MRRKNIFKAAIFLSILPFWISSCGVYEEEIVLIEQDAPAPIHPYPFSVARLTFLVTWSQSAGYEDLYSYLIIPTGNHIVDGGPEQDGCFFLGTYENELGERVSQLDCIDPFSGFYDLVVENLGYVVRNPLIEIISERWANSVVELTESSEIATVLPYEYVRVSTLFER